MLFVSHDRTFLRGLSNRVLELGGESGHRRAAAPLPGLLRRVRRSAPATRRPACTPDPEVISPCPRLQLRQADVEHRHLALPDLNRGDERVEPVLSDLDAVGAGSKMHDEALGPLWAPPGFTVDGDLGVGWLYADGDLAEAGVGVQRRIRLSRWRAGRRRRPEARRAGVPGTGPGPPQAQARGPAAVRSVRPSPASPSCL